MHLINQVHLEATASRRVLDVIQQIASIIDLGLRCGIDLDQIDEAALVDLLTRGTFATWLGTDSSFAIECLCQDSCDRGFANATRPCKQVSMMQTAGFERIDQRA